MARPLRLEFEGAFYHITSRGNLRDRIFFDDKDREKFLDILRRTKERYGYLLHTYALMENHYHLFLETPKANISQIMQNINTRYREYVGAYKEKESIVDTAETLSCFSRTKTAAMKAYGDFVKEGTGERSNPLEDVEAGVLLGSKIFIAKIRGMLQRRKPDEEIPQLKKLREIIPVDKVVKVCCKYYGKKEEELLKKGKGKEERQTAIYVSKIMSNTKNREIGRYFGIKGSTVSETLKRVENRIKRERKFKKEIEVLKKQLIVE